MRRPRLPSQQHRWAQSIGRLLLLVEALMITVPAPAQDSASSTAATVTSRFGSAESMNALLGQPLSSPALMSSVNGSGAFNAQVGCPAATAFLEVSMFPGSTGDLSALTLDSDPGFTGAYTQHLAINGPISGVCSNGVIQCDAGTFSDCTYDQWQASGSAGAWSVGLTPVAQSGLGACYCINNACGSSLALNNATRVLTDLSSGITHAINALLPRLTIAHGSYPEVTQEVLYGNQAGCGTDTAPEQYYNNAATSQMTAQGQAIAADPSTSYYQVQHSPAAANSAVTQASCTQQREIGLVSIAKSQVAQLVSRSSGATVDCGSGCLQFQLGSTNATQWQNNASCTAHNDSEQLLLTNASYITAATLQSYQVDDYGIQTVNGQVVWSSNAAVWSNPATVSGSSCETDQLNSYTPNLDLSPFFHTDGTLAIVNNNEVDNTGGAWSVIQLQVDEGCFIASNTISDGCSALESNSRCTLQSETVDGVQTVANYAPTGLQPLPTTENLSGACSYGPYTQPWYTTNRTYACNSSTPPYDPSAAVNRYTSIHTSFDTASGSYTDLTTSPSGVATGSSQNTGALPPADPLAACFAQCETSLPAYGSPVGDQSGAMATLNSGGLPATYSYRECDALVTNGVTSYSCPLQSGETLVSACACPDRFGAAASMMQSIRMSAQDSICAETP